mmetsp:Transcript_15274/g.32137  ORF Transcript_15274/g.32137 Transcript_15274/m.32137 type:complete len:234 (-) Transcript_15274:82-783(-)
MCWRVSFSLMSSPSSTSVTGASATAAAPKDTSGASVARASAAAAVPKDTSGACSSFRCHCCPSGAAKSLSTARAGVGSASGAAVPWRVRAARASSKANATAAAASAGQRRRLGAVPTFAVACLAEGAEALASRTSSSASSSGSGCGSGPGSASGCGSPLGDRGDRGGEVVSRSVSTLAAGASALALASAAPAVFVELRRDGILTARKWCKAYIVAPIPAGRSSRYCTIAAIGG